MPPVELPCRCFEASCLLVSFLAKTSMLQALTPPALRVVEAFPGRAPLGIACIDYRNTTLGPYGEVGISWPVVHADSPLEQAAARLPALPLLFEERWPGSGWWVHRLPVTTLTALEAGISVWGYPKFLATIEFGWAGSRRTCLLAEGGQTIFDVSVDTELRARPQRLTKRTFTLRNGQLLSTHIEFEGTGGGRTLLTHSDFQLGPHPYGRELGEMGLWGARAVNVQWFPVWRSVLPAPEPVVGTGSP